MTSEIEPLASEVARKHDAPWLSIAIDMAARGATAVDIATACKVTPTTVRNRLAAAGVSIRKVGSTTVKLDSGADDRLIAQLRAALESSAPLSAARALLIRPPEVAVRRMISDLEAIWEAAMGQDSAAAVADKLTPRLLASYEALAKLSPPPPDSRASESTLATLRQGLIGLARRG